MRNSKISRRMLLAAGTLRTAFSAHADTLDGPGSIAGFPASIETIPFGCVSPWLQPWRPLCNTISLAQIESGIGVVQNGFNTQKNVLDILYNCGVRHLRLEIPWGLVEAGTETWLKNQGQVIDQLTRLQAAGIRPLILLNSHHGAPCPFISSNLVVISDTPQGSTRMQVSSTGALIPGRSGFRMNRNLPMASILVAKIEGLQIGLSKPLPVSIPAGTEIEISTLSYEPFSELGTARYETTMQGWLDYVELVRNVTIAALGTFSAEDRGFDFEVWNELTFGSNFLNINNYYDPPLLDYNARAVWADLVTQTAALVSGDADGYRGVRISDGFANTIPWPASSLEPPRVSAISKHPYPPFHTYPEEQSRGTVLDAHGKKTTFIPAYQEFFPEYYGNVLQTESICRDVSDQTNLIYGTKHGRNAREINGKVNPAEVWITEMGCAPHDLGLTDPSQIEKMMTLFTLRTLFFYLAIGVERVYIYQAISAIGGFGLIDSKTEDNRSLPLLALQRTFSKIRGNANLIAPNLTSSITCRAIRSANDMILFQGGGTPNLPPLTASDSLVLITIQVSSARFAIIYYIMTRDIRVPPEEQKLDVLINGVTLERFALSCHDPVIDKIVEIDNVQKSGSAIALTLKATDMPRVLVLEAQASNN